MTSTAMGGSSAVGTSAMTMSGGPSGAGSSTIRVAPRMGKVIFIITIDNGLTFIHDNRQDGIRC